MVLLGLIVLHLYLLHLKGSTNPLGVGYSLDEIKFYPKFITKDLFGFFLLMFIVSISFLL